MKTIKIYLNDDGTINNFVQDIRINQYSFQDTLLNIYVPYSIVDLNITSDDDNIVYGTNIQMGMIYTKSNGTEQMGVGYLFTFVKDNVVLNNKRYVLFERTMPKEFTLYSGNQTYAINVVNTKTETTLDDNNNEIVTTTVTSIITSARYGLYITPSANFSEDTTETTDLENVKAQVNSLLATMPTKQDKNDSNINVYEDASHTTTTDNVNNALNNLNARETSTENNVDNLQNDMAQAQNDIADLQQQMVVDHRYIGQVNSANIPNAADLNTFVISQGYTVKNGDVVIWVYQIPNDTDVVYNCEYYSSGWRWYAIPNVEVAKNGSAGIVEGTYGVGESYDTLVSILNGKIVAIYSKDRSSTYREITTYLNTHDLTLENIINGNIVIDSSNFATYDNTEKSKPANERVSINDKFTTPSQVNSLIKAYSLPKTFNDINYYNFTDNEITTNIEDIPSNYDSKTLDVSSVGQNTILNCVMPITSEYTLNSGNSFATKIVYDNPSDYQEAIDFTFNVYLVDSENNETLITSVVKSQMLNQVGILEFSDNFKYITFNDEIDVDSTYHYRVELLALVGTTENATIDFISFQNLSSTFDLNIQMDSLIISSAKKGEIYYINKVATSDGIGGFVINLTETDIPLQNLIYGSFVAQFEFTISNATELAIDTPIYIVYTDNDNNTYQFEFATKYANSAIYAWLKPALYEKTHDTNYHYKFSTLTVFPSLLKAVFEIDYPKSTILQLRLAEYNTLNGLGLANDKAIIIADENDGYILATELQYNSLKQKIGVLNLTGTSGTLTADELAEMQKEIAIINLGDLNKVLYKVDESLTSLIFTGIDTAIKVLSMGVLRLGQDEVLINKTTRAWFYSIRTRAETLPSSVTVGNDSASVSNFGDSLKQDVRNVNDNKASSIKQTNDEIDLGVEDANDNTTRTSFKVIKNYNGTSYDIAEIKGNKLIDLFLDNSNNRVGMLDSALKNLYNLGYYDYVIGNVITRQTGYLDLSQLDWYLDGSNRWYNRYGNNIAVPSDNDTPADIKSNVYNAISNNDYSNRTSVGIAIAISNGVPTLFIYDDSISTTSDLKAKLSGKQLQIKLSTPYTETVIENQPLLTLNQDGCNFLNDEYNKQLNLYQCGNQVVTANNETYKHNTCQVYLEQGTYTLNCSISGTIKNIDVRLLDNTLIAQNYGNEEPITFAINTAQTIQIWFYASVDTAITSTTTYNNIMLVKGSTAMPYQEYNGAIVHKKDIEPVLLWENASPNSSFAAQTITVQDMSLFKYIVIEYITRAGDIKQLLKVKYVASGVLRLSYIYYESGTNYQITRNLTFTNATSIDINNGYAGIDLNNYNLIPLAIYGTNVL